MNVEFLIVFTSNGLVFATLLYLIMTREIPDPKGSATTTIWSNAKILMTRRRDAGSSCIPSVLAPVPGAVILLDRPERRTSAHAPKSTSLECIPKSGDA
jgi:hypothetical protein